MFASTQAGLRAALLVMSLALAPADVLSQNRPTDAIALAGGTRLAMDSAARQGRFAELARWFSPDAVLVIGADTVVGRAAVLEQIMARTSGALQALTSFHPSEVERCTDGAYERGGSFTILLDQPTLTETLRGRYALRWIRTPDGGLAIKSLVLNDSPLPAPLGIPGCRLAHREELLRRRFSLSVSSPLGYGSSQTPGDVEAGLLRQGYPDGVVRSLYPRTDRGGAPIVVSAHARIWRGFGFELVSDIVPESHLLAGHSPVTFYRVRLDYTARTSAALLTARFGAARIGAGPARHKADWSSVERHIAGAPAPVDTLIGVNAWSTTQTGWMVRATYMYPLSRGVFIELAGRYSSISAARTRNTGHFDPEPVGHSGYQVALGIGVAR